MFKFIKSFSLIEWLVFLIIMAFNGWWPIWGYGTVLPAIICYASEALLLFILWIRGRLRIGRCIIIMIILMLYFVVAQMYYVFHGSSALIIFIILVADALTNKESKNIIRLITKYLSLSIILSLVPWLVHQYIAPLPLYSSIDVSAFKHGTPGSIVYENYFFFIGGITGDESNAFRFYSLFDEPGVLGTLAAFILWANKYNFKDKDNIIILIGSIFTFSLAFYILTIIGWLANSRFKISKVLITAVAISLIGVILFYALQDNLAFQQSIIGRFTDYENHGVEHRTSFEMNQLWDQTVSSAKIFFGLGSGAVINMDGASYKIFFLEYGVFGFLLIVATYLKLIPRRSYYAYVTIALFVISFLQRPALFTAQNIVLCTCIVKGYEYELYVRRVVEVAKRKRQIKQNNIIVE